MPPALRTPPEPRRAAGSHDRDPAARRWRVLHRLRQRSPFAFRFEPPASWLDLSFPWTAAALGSFSPANQPPLSRHNYRREMLSATFLPFAQAAVEGGTLGVIARKAFAGAVDTTLLNFFVAAIVAAPAFANITSFVWVRLTHGRDKVRSINALQVSFIACVALIALTPISFAGLVMLTALAILARMCLAGVTTLRSTLWGANYPRRARAQVTGRLTTVQTLVVAAVGTALGAAMEWNPEAFRGAFPVAALLGLLGVRSFARIRHRRRSIALRAERQTHLRDRPSFNPLALARVLIEDRPYAAFMGCQFVIGIGNMMSWAPFIIMMEERFEHIGYLESIVIAQAIPMLMMPLFIPFWARLIDKGHIVRFRAVHSWVFVAMSFTALLAGLFELWPLLYLAAFVKGVGFAGGSLAWQLGHLDFAPEEKAGQYMAVHVTLTGVRGLIAPFLGVGAYTFFQHHLASRTYTLATENGLVTVYDGPGGPLTFALSTLIVSAGALGFMALARYMAPREGAGM